MRFNGDPAKSVLPHIPVEALRRTTDGEHVGRVRSLVVNKNQLPDNVIERGSKVVQTLADDDAQTRIGGGEDEVKIKGSAAFYVRVSLGNNVALVETTFNVLPYRCEVFLCPDEFLPNSVERMIHEAA